MSLFRTKSYYSILAAFWSRNYHSWLSNWRLSKRMTWPTQSVHWLKLLKLLKLSRLFPIVNTWSRGKTPTPETPIQKMLSQLQEPQRHKHQSQWHSDRILKYIYAHKQHQHQCRKLHFVLNAKDVINFCLRHVSANKVDRDYLTFAVSMKADKKDVTDLIDVKYFNHVTKSIYESIDDMKAKIKALHVTTNWK